MAKVKFGEIIVAMRGKLGGHVHTKNHYGNVTRAWVKPANPRSTAQQASRAVLKDASKAWRGLTQDQRDSWIAFAQTWTRKDRLGETTKLTGANLYVSSYKIMTLVGETPLTTAPAVISTIEVESISVTQAAGTHVLTATFSPAIPSGRYMVLEATRPMSAGKKYVASDFRHVAVYDNTDTSPLVITTDYTDVFGRNIGEGEIAYFRAYSVNPLYPVKKYKTQSGPCLGVA